MTDMGMVAATACYLGGVGVTIVDVFARLLLSRSLPGGIELTTLLIALGALISIPGCYAHHGHVTAKLLSELSPGRFARKLELAGAFASLVFAVALCGLLAISLWHKLGSAEITTDLGLLVWPIFAILVLALALAVIGALYGLMHKIEVGEADLEHRGD